MKANQQQSNMKEYSNSEFLNELEEMYRTEQTLLIAIPSFAKSAVSKGLTSTFDLYAAQTADHISKLKRLVNNPAENIKAAYPAIEQLIMYLKKVISDSKLHASGRDLELISTTRKILHFQLGKYKQLGKTAAELGLTNVANVLETIYDQEKERESIFFKIESEQKSSGKNNDELMQVPYYFSLNKSTGN